MRQALPRAARNSRATVSRMSRPRRASEPDAGVFAAHHERGSAVHDMHSDVSAQTGDVGAPVVDTEEEPARQRGQVGIGLEGDVEFTDPRSDVGE